ncbi:MAG: hypothetical protein BWZ08_02174 [candidate division BRC1 bacterium ADurb.BinA292]|nr:MAG: hypothetical protein BWZ08_02174 [candidate division BRC1 bacterium ADurb.BinA292]
MGAMTDEFFEVPCPECKSVLIIRRRDGKLMETRKPLLEETTGDRFEDAYERVRRAGNEIERKVAEAREREKGKMDRLNALFNDSLEKAKKKGPVQKPKREVDLD